MKSVLFALVHLTNQSLTHNSKNLLLSKSSSEINYISKNSNNVPSKKRITRVRFNDASRTAISKPQIRIQLAAQVSDQIGQAIPAPQVSDQIRPTIPALQVPTNNNTDISGCLMSVPLLRLAHMYQHSTTLC